MNDTYTITEISKTLNTHKTKIRRTIDQLGIEAINENNREHKNSPKIYDNEAKNSIINQLKSETRVEQEQNKSETRVEHEQNNETQQEMIELLKDRLYKADRDKEELTRALQEAQQLVNQQQQLSLQAHNKIGILELELKDRIQEEVYKNELKNEDKKPKWYNIFKKNK